MGLYNPLGKKLKYDKNTGVVTKWHVKLYKKEDEIAAHHDICYEMDKNKCDCNREMVIQLDEIPYGKIQKKHWDLVVQKM